jgi:hypothetical protein
VRLRNHQDGAAGGKFFLFSLRLMKGDAQTNIVVDSKEAARKQKSTAQPRGAIFLLAMSDDENEGVDLIHTGGEHRDIPRPVTHVEVHPSVRVIERATFSQCSRRTTVNLGGGLENAHLIPPVFTVIKGSGHSQDDQR